jgi:hypothetical protein
VKVRLEHKVDVLEHSSWVFNLASSVSYKEANSMLDPYQRKFECASSE